MNTSKFTHTLATGLLAALLGVAVPAALAAEEDAASAADVRQETAELLQALKSYGASQRDEAVEQSRAALHNLDRRIAALEAELFEHWEQMDQAARDRARESLQALREQRTRVAEWYGSMKSGSASAWGHLRQGFTNAYQALHDAWEQSEEDVHSGENR